MTEETKQQEEKIAPLKQLEKVDLPGYTISNLGIVRDPEGEIVTPHLIGDKLACLIGGNYITFVADNVARHFIKEPTLWETVGFRDGDIMNCNVKNLFYYDRHPHSARKPTPIIPIEPSGSKYWIRRYNVDGEIVAEYASFKEAAEAAIKERPMIKSSTVKTRLRTALKSPDRCFCGTTWKISHPQILADSYEDKPKPRPEGWIRCYSIRGGRELVKEYANIDEVIKDDTIKRKLSPSDVAQRLRELANGTRKTFRNMVWEFSDPSILETRKLGMTFAVQLKEEETPAESPIEVEVIQPIIEEHPTAPEESIQQPTESEEEETWIKRYENGILTQTFKDIDEAVDYIHKHDNLKATIPALRCILRRHIRGVESIKHIGGCAYEASGPSALVSRLARKMRRNANLRGWDTRRNKQAVDDNGQWIRRYNADGEFIKEWDDLPKFFAEMTKETGIRAGEIAARIRKVLRGEKSTALNTKWEASSVDWVSAAGIGNAQPAESPIVAPTNEEHTQEVETPAEKPTEPAVVDVVVDEVNEVDEVIEVVDEVKEERKKPLIRRILDGVRRWFKR